VVILMGFDGPINVYFLFNIYARLVIVGWFFLLSLLCWKLHILTIASVI
jgi:hypothetical protein